ncbi:ATP-binding protein [Cellulomonas sp.]|uniref:ATP-binding protein n=1 Tax=Cellulomonas sp. TaxID=40001 RepID=UPI003BA8FA1B
MSAWTAPHSSLRWTEASPTRFVGRRAERALLDVAWAAAARGSRQVLFVGGEPGVGKSRLLAETARHLERNGAAVLAGGCAADLTTPYQPFVEPIAALCPALTDGSLALRPSSRLSRDRVLAILDTVIGTEGPGGSPSDRGYRQEVFDAVVETLVAAATAQPLALVLEDVHWASESALDLLSYVVERTPATALLVLASQRTTAPDRSVSLADHVSRLYRLDSVHRLDLAPLDLEEIAEYLVHEGGVPDDRAPEGAARMRERTGGNPFFLRELVRDLGAGGRDVLRPDGPAPQSVQDTIESRVRTLGAEARAVLELAAVIGDVVDTDLLLSASDAGPAETLEHVDAAIDRHLLEPRAGVDTLVQFPHTLARQVVLDHLPRARRTHLHLQVAQALERPGPRTSTRVRQLAHHYDHAHALGYTAEAVRYLLQAAHLAEDALAHDEAADLFVRAAELEPDPGGADDARLRAADCRILAGDLPGARELAESVAADATSPHRLRGAVLYEESSWRSARPSSRAVELLTAALAPTPEVPDEPLRVRALAGLGRSLVFDHRDAEAAALAAQTIAHARRLGDDALLVVVLEAGLTHGHTPADLPRKLERAQEVSHLCQRTGDLWHLGHAAFHRSLIAYLTGDDHGLTDARADLARTSEATRQPYFAYFAGSVDYTRQFVTGHFDDARRTSAALLELGATLETDGTTGPWGVQQYMLRRETGDLESVRPLITGEEDLHAAWAPGLLTLYQELGMADATRRALTWLVADELARYASTVGGSGVLALLCDAAVAVQDEDAAERLRPAVQEFSGMNLVFGGLVAAMGSADRYLGQLDSLLGRGDPERSFAIAEHMDASMGAPVHRAETLAAHVLHHRRRGPAGCDVPALEREARGVATTLGLPRVLRRLDAAEHDPGRSRHPDGLTDREVEVLCLLAEGLSNRQIAGTLVISENTAANHVRNIRIKTGCENRTRAAMYAVTHGLLT